MLYDYFEKIETNRWKMSRHKCDKELYKAFLQASCIRYSGLALSEVSPDKLSHDSVSRWLKKSSSSLRPKEIWQISKRYIQKNEPCLLICDDTILDKHRSKYIDLVHYQYSGNAHNIIAGIGMVNLLWYGLNNQEALPIDYRIYAKEIDGKTKNKHFQEMLKLAKRRGLTPEAIVMDSWYSSLDNLKMIRDLNWIWIAGLKKNRKVNRNQTLESLDIPEEGLKMHLRGYGWVMVFRFEAKNGRTDYTATNMDNPSRSIVEGFLRSRWSIEVYHRELKQTCGIESCQARTGRAQRNHIFLSIAAWLDRHRRKSLEGESFYQQQWNEIKKAISAELQRIFLLTTA
jgi:hypothetical protein